MGAKFDEPALVFGDNKSVLRNARALASMLNKFNAIVYHFVSEVVARDDGEMHT